MEPQGPATTCIQNAVFLVAFLLFSSDFCSYRAGGTLKLDNTEFTIFSELWTKGMYLEGSSSLSFCQRGYFHFTLSEQ